MVTTIAISQDLKEELKQFGTKGESYGEILKRLVENAKKHQLEDFLMDDSNCIPIEKALEEA